MNTVLYTLNTVNLNTTLATALYITKLKLNNSSTVVVTEAVIISSSRSVKHAFVMECQSESHAITCIIKECPSDEENKNKFRNSHH